MILEDIKKLQTLIDNATNIVFFGGAGVSTESGIPDFRSQDGLYHTQYQYRPEIIISGSFFRHDPKEFYRFYKDKMVHLDARPNACHEGLAKLEEKGKLKAVITQNIDGLHQMAGSKNVYELHGSIHRNHCVKCGKFYTLKEVLKDDVPYCLCGGIIKPDVTLYEEALPTGILEKSIKAIQKADLFIIGGTSLVVQPAAGLIYYTKPNANIVMINKSVTGRESLATLVIQDAIGEVFSKLKYE